MKHLILHIPHSSTHIPDTSFFILQELKPEIELITDWQTEEIFNVPKVTKVIAKFSRVFCDVERLADEDEPMYARGLGFYYTRGEHGQVIRKLNQKHKEFVYKNYYQPHHQTLTSKVEAKIIKWGKALIIDCHSFSSYPLLREQSQDPARPDICLGVDPHHTPSSVTENFRSYFEKNGLKVEINKPYSGTIVPLKFYKKKKDVQSIMIEVNKKLYMDEQTLSFYPNKVNWLNRLITSLIYIK